MNFEQLKKLVRKLGGLLVLDGDKPEFVILRYDQYENNLGGSSVEEEVKPDSGEEEKTIEKLNQEILALKEEIRQKESAELLEDTETEEPVADVIDFE